MDNLSLWKAVLAELELSLSKANFTTWFKSTFVDMFDEGVVTVGVPNGFTKSWLEQKYRKEILQTLKKVSPIEIKDVNFKVASKPTQSQHEPIENLLKEKPQEEPVDVSSLSTMPKRTITPPSVVIRSQPMIQSDSTGLNPKYVFDSFVVGKGNELANAACMAVAENPGFSYNPLFLYGGVGLGKTHLMQAVGNKIKKNNPKANVVYVTSEQFTNEFVSAIKSNTIDRFKNKYRSADALLIDDIQFIAGKEQTQEEFFHTFNVLHQTNKQVVLTSDRAPKMLSSIEQRLISRFEWGMIADIGVPDLETRVAILMKKCQERHYNLDGEIIHFIAQNISTNIRELEGALNRIIAQHQLENKQITLDSVKDILSNIASSPKKGSVTPKVLMENVANYFDISVEDLKGPSRKKELVTPRQIAMYLMREELKASYPSIGHQLGGRDHTTAIHAYSKVSEDLSADEKLRNDLDLIRQRLYAS